MFCRARHNISAHYVVMHMLRWNAIALFVITVSALVACGTGATGVDGAESPTVTVNSDLNSRGATEAALGESITRPDEAYTLTMTQMVERGQSECSTYGKERTPEGDGIRLITAHMILETGVAIPPGVIPTYVPNFYATDADGMVKSNIGGGGEYSCAGDGEGRSAANQNPMPNAKIERTETFMVPIGSVALGYREMTPSGGPFAVEWSLDAITKYAEVEENPTIPPAATSPTIPTTTPTGTASQPTVPPAANTDPIDQIPNPYPNSVNTDGQPTGQGGGALTACAPLDLYQPGTGIFTRPDGSTYFDYAAQCLVGGSMR